jgi:uncharacterized protein YebE (UPF0316 family)
MMTIIFIAAICYLTEFSVRVLYAIIKGLTEAIRDNK